MPEQIKIKQIESEPLAEEENEAREKMKKLVTSLVDESFGPEDLPDLEKEAQDYLEKINETRYLYRLIYPVTDKISRGELKIPEWQFRTLHNVLNDIAARIARINGESQT